MGGGVAGQRIATKFFDPEVVGQDVAERMHGHIFDPKPLRDLGRRAYTNTAIEQGRLTTGTDVPVDRLFGIAYIASPTGIHAASLKQVYDLPHQPQRIIMEKPVASGWQEERALADLIDGHEGQIYAHEPYLLSTGLKRMKEVVEDQRQHGNFPIDIRVTSSKDRTADVAAGRTGNDSVLGAFGVEVPHTHAAASVLAGVELDAEHIVPGHNLHFTNIAGNPLSEATYTEFFHDDATIRVAQGLGPFVMKGDGAMLDQPVGIIREARVLFADTSSVHLDLRPAVDSQALPYRQTVLTFYDASGEVVNQEILPDYPFRTLARHVLREIDDPSAPRLPDIGIVQSLARCVKLRNIAATARTESERPVPSAAFERIGSEPLAIEQVLTTLRERLPSIASGLVSARHDLSNPAERSFADNPDDPAEHSPSWHQYGILTHSEAFLRVVDQELPLLGEQWGVAAEVNTKLDEKVDGLPRRELLRIVSLLHDIGKFTARTLEEEAGAMSTSFRDHETHSRDIIQSELKGDLLAMGLSEAQVAYVARCAGHHFELGKARRAAKDAGGYTIAFAQSPVFQRVAGEIIAKNSDVALEIGLMFIADSLGKTEVAATATTDEGIRDQKDQLEQEIHTKGLNPRIINQALQQPVNLEVGCRYLQAWADTQK